MIRNLKALGLATVAVLAMGAVAAASGAQAAPPEFHCTSVTTANCMTVGTSTIGELKVAGGKVTCTAEYTATAPKTSGPTVTVTAKYTNCKAFGVKSEVKMNECDYEIHMQEGAPPATAKVDVKCPVGKKIEIIASTLPCTITIGEQAGREHVIFTNEESKVPTDVLAHFTVSNIAVTKVQSTCPEGAGAANGELIDTVTFQGFEDPGGTLVALHVF